MAASQFCIRISDASFPHRELKAFLSVAGTYFQQQQQSHTLDTFFFIYFKKIRKIFSGSIFNLQDTKSAWSCLSKLRTSQKKQFRYRRKNNSNTSEVETRETCQSKTKLHAAAV